MFERVVKHTCGVSQGPGPTGAIVKPTWSEAGLREEVPRGPRVDEGKVLEQNAFPAVVDVSNGLCATVGEVRVPFLPDEFFGPDQRGTGDNGDHVDPLNGVEIAVEPRGVVAFILEELVHKSSALASQSGRKIGPNRHCRAQAGATAGEAIKLTIPVTLFPMNPGG